jgi:hypothetical protein
MKQSKDIVLRQLFSGTKSAIITTAGILLAVVEVLAFPHKPHTSFRAAHKIS